METSNVQPNSEELENNDNEEKNFVKLFDEVLKQNKGELSDEAIANGVYDVIQIFQHGISGSCVKENLNTQAHKCGFFYRYSPLFAGITRTRFLTALRNCEKLRSCFHRSSLKMVDVGSGAGSALVGLCSALDSFEENIDEEIVRGFPFQSFEVIAMDNIKKWEDFFEDTVQKLKNVNYDFGNASRLFREKEINPFFLYCNVLNHENLQGVTQLNGADIVFMKGFLSVLRKDAYREHASRAIVSAMKKGSLLVIIESPTYEKYFQLENLRLIFTTRKYCPTSEDSQQPSTPQNISLGTQDPELSSQAVSLSSDDRSSISQNLRSEYQVNDSVSQASGAESDNEWEHYHRNKEPDTNDHYSFAASEIRKYGQIGLARRSNQQIFVLEKFQ